MTRDNHHGKSGTSRSPSKGVPIWNQWREEHPNIQIQLDHADLSGANLSGADFSNANLEEIKLNHASLQEADLLEARLYNGDLSGADLREANLIKTNLMNAQLNEANLMWVNLIDANLKEASLVQANLTKANLDKASLHKTNLKQAILRNATLRNARFIDADLSEADLSEADLSGATLSNVNLVGAILQKANLTRVDLSDADLSGVDLSGADLRRANLVKTNLQNAILTNCLIYGISVWDVQLEGAKQLNLVITLPDQPTITVDNLKVAQFIYLLLNNTEIRDVIDTITSKVVLILGRFAPEPKAILDAMKNHLRKQNYLPVLFDLDEPSNRDVTETITTLARLSRFIIADITDPRSIPQELALIVPELPSVPIQPIIHSSQQEYGMFAFFSRFPWVLPVYRYTDEAILLQSLQEHVIVPAEQKAQELARR